MGTMTTTTTPPRTPAGMRALIARLRARAMDPRLPKRTRERAKRSLARWRARLARAEAPRLDAGALRAVCPSLSAQRAERLARDLGAAMHRFGIVKQSACLHFISQTAHESGEYRYTREIWGPTAVQSGYWRRRELQGGGPLYPGLGYATRGAGFLQTTGRANLRRAANRLGIGYSTLLVRCGSTKYAALLACIWWSDHFPTSMAGMTVEQVSRRVNGGYNGLADRKKYHARAEQVANGLVPNGR
jgi:putative chitinase